MLAQMIDNDQDGCADDVKVVEKLREFRTGMAMFQDQNSVEMYADKIANTFKWQDLQATETEPTCSGSDETTECRDAAIEEIFHIISGVGLSTAYPKVFGECKAKGKKRSKMQKQMDIARGGYFDAVPISYPPGAIYHYDDKTCEYDCMGTEFMYWGITSLLGGQDQRANMNMQEWEASTAAKLKKKLPGMHKLLTNEKTTSMKLFSLKGELPGSGGSNYGARETYKPLSQTCPTGCGLDGSGCGPMPTTENNNRNKCSTVGPCEDNSKFKKKVRGKKRNCNWFATRPRNLKKRCLLEHVVENCKISCDVCGKTGEEVCERYGLKKFREAQCQAISCCKWNNGQCWSNVQNGQCW